MVIVSPKRSNRLLTNDMVLPCQPAHYRHSSMKNTPISIVTQWSVFTRLTFAIRDSRTSASGKSLTQRIILCSDRGCQHRLENERLVDTWEWPAPLSQIATYWSIRKFVCFRDKFYTTKHYKTTIELNDVHYVNEEGVWHRWQLFLGQPSVPQGLWRRACYRKSVTRGGIKAASGWFFFRHLSPNFDREREARRYCPS